MTIKQQLNMNKIKFLSYLLLMGLFFTSCGDDGDTTPPVVTIQEPADGTVYSAADIIPLRATVTDETKLVSINLSSNLGLNETINTFDSETEHSLGVNITLNTTTSAGTYEIKVSATDDSGNVGNDVIDITIQ